MADLTRNEINYLLRAEREGVSNPDSVRALAQLRSEGFVSHFDPEPDARDELAENLTNAAIHGAMWSFSDEVLGTADYLADKVFGSRGGETTLKGNVERRRMAVEQFRASDPFKAYGAEMVGGAFTGSAALGLGKGALALGKGTVGLAKATRPVSKVKSDLGLAQPKTIVPSIELAAEPVITQGVGKAIKLGAVYGAGYGVGEAEGGLSERIPSGLIGGGVGMFGGGVMNWALLGARKSAQIIGTKVANIIKYPRWLSHHRGLMQVVKAIDDNKKGNVDELEKLVTRMKEFDETGTPYSLGELLNTSGIRVPAEAIDNDDLIRDGIIKLFEHRLKGENNRITEAIQQNISMRSLSDVLDKIAGGAKESANKFYDQALFNYKNVPLFVSGSARLDDILVDDVGQKILTRAAASVRSEAQPLLGEVQKADKLSNVRIAEIIEGLMGMTAKDLVKQKVPLRVLLEIKNATDDLITQTMKKTDPGEGFTSEGRKALTRIKRIEKYLKNDEIDTQGFYKQAAESWSTRASVFEGLDIGASLARPGAKADTLIRQFNKLDNEAARDAARAGFARAIITSSRKGTAMEIIANMVGQRGGIKQQILSQIAPNDQARDKLMLILKNEAFAHSQMNALLGNLASRGGASGDDAARKVMGSIGAIIGSELPLGGHALVRARAGGEVGKALVKKDTVSPGYIADTFFRDDIKIRDRALQQLVRRWHWLDIQRRLTRGGQRLQASGIAVGQTRIPDTPEGRAEVVRGAAAPALRIFTGGQPGEGPPSATAIFGGRQ
jgi:hypothetical protein